MPELSNPESEKFQQAPKPGPIFAGAFGTVALAAGTSLVVPDRYSASSVALIFVLATYGFALRRGHPHSPSHYGLRFGGLFEDEKLSIGVMAKESARAFAVALAIAALVFPLYALAFPLYYSAHLEFDWLRASKAWTSDAGLVDWILGQLLVVALPEEIFFRGWLQTALDDRYGTRLRFFGVAVGPALFLSSAIFALGHVLTIWHPGRLAVFFPSLLFGLVRAKSGGVGAAILLHTASNLLAAYLLAGYGLRG